MRAMGAGDEPEQRKGRHPQRLSRRDRTFSNRQKWLNQSKLMSVVSAAVAGRRSRRRSLLLCCCVQKKSVCRVKREAGRKEFPMAVLNKNFSGGVDRAQATTSSGFVDIELA
ncbi:hypothetical protein DdX_19649 [Ditylenchus destructor]|uniref:Uncharacterized protein n=1 Tax=Ditylenchus destructor TaxID=166010 RepID=A0AAD4MI19_9BILA|nr:hypothetical protein DdX_19649 [Ditylenchus destructor]